MGGTDPAQHSPVPLLPASDPADQFRGHQEMRSSSRIPARNNNTWGFGTPILPPAPFLPPPAGPSLFLRANSRCCSYPGVTTSPNSSCKFPRELLQVPGSSISSGPHKNPFPSPSKKVLAAPPVWSRSALSIQNEIHRDGMGKKGEMEKDAVVRGSPRKCQDCHVPGFDSKCHKIPTWLLPKDS